MHVVAVGPFGRFESVSRIHFHGHLHYVVKAGVAWCDQVDGGVLCDVCADPQRVRDGNVAYFGIVAVVGKRVREVVYLD